MWCGVLNSKEQIYAKNPEIHTFGLSTRRLFCSENVHTISIFCRRKQINSAFNLWCQGLQVIKYTLHSSQSRSEIFGEACAQANVVDGLILFQVSAL